MATSLEDETQQPSFYGQLSSPTFAPSSQPSPPPLTSVRRGPRQLPPSSPIAESSAGGFLHQQLNQNDDGGPRGDVEESMESLRASEVGRGAQTVMAGNLLRVGGPSGYKRPGWNTTQPASQLTEPEEEDELESSSSRRRNPEHEPEPASVPSPVNSPPPISKGPVTRKRKNPPSPSSAQTTPVKSGAGQKPISAHSPARLNLSTNKPSSSRTRHNPLPTPPVTALPPAPSRTFSRTASRATKQKVVEEEPDSFAEERHRGPIREKSSKFFDKLFSDEAGLEIPKEMQSSNGDNAYAESEDAEMASQAAREGAEGAPGDKAEEEIRQRAANSAEREDADDPVIRADQHGGSVGTAIPHQTQASDSSHGSRVLIPASTDSPGKADVTAESILFPNSDSQPVLPITDTQYSSHSLPSSSVPAGGATQASVQSQVSESAIPANQEHSLVGRPRRGFTNVGMSLTQGDSPISGNARPDRRELFSSPAEGVGSSQIGSQSQSQAWQTFQPTQVRASIDMGSNGGGGNGNELEPTQIVSEESHQRAQDVLSERRRIEREDEAGSQGMEVDPVVGSRDGYTQLNTQPGESQGESVPVPGASGRKVPIEDTQQVSEESLERAQNLWRERKELEDRERREAALANIEETAPADESIPSRIETQEATYMTRRSDDEPTQHVSAETQRRAMAVAGTNRSISGSRQSSPGQASEARVLPRIAAHRQLKRRNHQETQSAPQPLLAVPSLAPIVTSARSRTDPVVNPANGRLVTPPRPAISASRSLRRRSPNRQSNADIQIQIDVNSGSPALQGPSSSMQEAEDLLQLGVITQATNDARSQTRSASPPVRGASTRRSARPRVLASSSTSPSPKSPTLARRRSSPIEFSQSLPLPSNDTRQQTFEPTYLNAETEQTLPEATKPASPVRTYGTRRAGAIVSPAEPPARAIEPVVEIPVMREKPRGPRRSKQEALREHLAVPKSGIRDKRGTAKVQAQELADGEDEESPDPLASAMDEDTGSKGDRIEVDGDDEPESPPTPIDTEDFSYRPVLPTRTSNPSTIARAPKKASVPARESPARAKKTAIPSGPSKKGRKVFSAVTQFPKSAPSRDTPSTELSATDAQISRKTKATGGTKSARGSMSTVLTAAPSEDLSELSEPESPPTPQDPEDETFKISNKGLGAGKKRTSRQNSSTASASAGPSKAKTPAKPRKSKLSTATDDAALPTPTYTSQQSTTEQNGEEEEEDISERPLALAYYKINKSYYPCRVIAQIGEIYRIQYLDHEKGTAGIDELRRCELKAGDKVKFDMASMRKKTDLEVGQNWVDGDGTVKVRNKDGASAGEFEILLLRFPLSTINLRFDDRKVTPEMLQDVPEEEQNEKEKAAELARRSTASVAHKTKVGTNTFSDKIFLITPTDDSTLALKNTIERNGGVTCDWSDLFAATQFGQPLKADLGRTPFLITPDIDSGKAGMKVKGMVALSFGIPCLAPEYVDAAMADPTCDWLPYAIATGVSAFTSTPALQFIDEAWGTSSWSIRNARNRRRPLANMRVLFMNLNPKVADLEKIIGTCVFGLGAISFNTTTPALDVKDDTYDLLIISNNPEKGSKKKDLPPGVRDNKKAGDVQWLKQCMVSGARPPMRLYSY